MLLPETPTPTPYKSSASGECRRACRPLHAVAVLTLLALPLAARAQQAGQVQQAAPAYAPAETPLLLDAMNADGTIEAYTKKEQLKLGKEREKLEKTLGGIKGMGKVPGVLFVVDPKNEEIAVSEAKKLGIPVVAIVDTNCDPDDINYVIPGNDDAIRAIRLVVSSFADACIDASQIRKGGGVDWQESVTAVTAQDGGPEVVRRGRAAPEPVEN